MLHTITTVIPESNAQLRLTYANQEHVVVDFHELIQRGGIFSALADPSFFAQVSLGEHGRYIEWPGELDFCADSLWLKAQSAIQALPPQRKDSLQIAA